MKKRQAIPYFHEFLLSNPQCVFNTRDVSKIQSHFNPRITHGNLSRSLKHLVLSGQLYRSTIRATFGFLYSMNKVALIICQNRYLSGSLNLDKGQLRMLTEIKPVHNPKKTGVENKYFSNVDYLALLVGFMMADGHLSISKRSSVSIFYFRYKDDAIKCQSDFNRIFPQMYSKLNYHAYCYNLTVCNRQFCELMGSLGVPVGNKVLNPFEVPSWIMAGSNSIKRNFLSGLYGGEGSAPHNGQFRIQFVISKDKSLLNAFLSFLNQIRLLLFQIGIYTTHIQLRNPGGNRKLSARFYITGYENVRRFHEHLFYAYASEKQTPLENLFRNPYKL